MSRAFPCTHSFLMTGSADHLAAKGSCGGHCFHQIDFSFVILSLGGRAPERVTWQSCCFIKRWTLSKSFPVESAPHYPMLYPSKEKNVVWLHLFSVCLIGYIAPQLQSSPVIRAEGTLMDPLDPAARGIGVSRFFETSADPEVIRFSNYKGNYQVGGHV